MHIAQYSGQEGKSSCGPTQEWASMDLHCTNPSLRLGVGTVKQGAMEKCKGSRPADWVTV